jgi:hypothetical protein
LVFLIEDREEIRWMYTNGRRRMRITDESFCIPGSRERGLAEKHFSKENLLLPFLVNRFEAP